MTVIYFILSFTIYNIQNDYDWEQGTVIARSCREAISYIENGLRNNQRLIIGNCSQVTQ